MDHVGQEVTLTLLRRLVAEEDQPPLIVAIGRPASPEATPPVRHSVTWSISHCRAGISQPG